MKFNRFEEILIWEKAKELTINIYKELKFCKDFSFNDQIKRAAVSIINNVAEGFERKGNKEFKKFLFIAKGFCGEVRSMLHLGYELKYLNHVVYQNLLNRSLEISKMLSGLIKTL